MKKSILLLAAASVTLATSHAATLQVSTPPFSLASVGNAGGVATNGLTWGVVVDTGANGFGFDMNFLAPLNLVDGFINGSDDYLYLSANTTTALGPSNGVVTSVVANYDADAAVTGGQAYKLIWFDGVAAGGALDNGQSYGLSAATSALPAGNADLQQPAEFVGDNGAASNPITVVPEPSIALLGGLGLLGLIRRRR